MIVQIESAYVRLTYPAMAKRAVLVGCNYPGTESELKGCVNDVMSMRSILTSRFGFDEADIVVLVDTDESFEQPTHLNIMAHLNALITGSEPGDVLVFHFSGHGTRVRPASWDANHAIASDLLGIKTYTFFEPLHVCRSVVLCCFLVLFCFVEPI